MPEHEGTLAAECAAGESVQPDPRVPSQAARLGWDGEGGFNYQRLWGSHMRRP
jgi:hypothetical protein